MDVKLTTRFRQIFFLHDVPEDMTQRGWMDEVVAMNKREYGELRRKLQQRAWDAVDDHEDDTEVSARQGRRRFEEYMHDWVAVCLAHAGHKLLRRLEDIDRCRLVMRDPMMNNRNWTIPSGTEMDERGMRLPKGRW